ncbi:hypothetical protein B0H16DRAFT_1497112 [Mycena metata]|uniref:Uncharacterized protein n=1 Tax=Mycena metata TaxID=1033252 RepID=A0AAD7NZ59_9AGAR|nr:hypothetical protein B0H16DRAFT_1497112 [Mycena metata]
MGQGLDLKILFLAAPSSKLVQKHKRPTHVHSTSPLYFSSSSSGVGLLQPMPSSHSSSPRRRTLGTDDRREIVSPQMRSNSGRAPRGAGSLGRSMTINLQLADDGQQIRPLPRIPPTPNSAPPIPHRHLSRSASMRPLPSLPELGALAISVTPATPLPPPTPTVASCAHLSPPTIRRGPPRFGSLSLQTSSDALQANAFGSCASPPSPTLPEPPSPRTAQRKRMHKLRRYLGESVQVVLDRPDKADVLAGLRRAVKAYDAYPDLMVEEVLDFDGDDDDSDASSEASNDSWEMYNQSNASWDATRNSKRSSTKWIRERGKDRWTEADFSKILEDLRAL